MKSHKAFPSGFSIAYDSNRVSSPGMRPRRVPGALKVQQEDVLFCVGLCVCVCGFFLVDAKEYILY